MTDPRIKELRRHLAPKARGIEIGAYHNPITPRSQGFRAVHLDLFDEHEQRRRATADPFLTDKDVARIEAVDLIGSAVDIAELVTAKYGEEKFDYVVSSHNLEHLPNPIKFLQGCQQVLKPGGVVSLAMPDHRYCFDFYRARSEAGEWLEAFAEDRKVPTQGQLFRWVAAAANVNGDASWNPDVKDFPQPWDLLGHALEYWNGTVKLEYLDAHCWAFTPASFQLIIEDLRQLGFHTFDVISVSPPQGNEFFAHLRNVPDTEPFAEGTETYFERRARTMRQVIIESGAVVQQFAEALAAPAPVPEPTVPAGTQPLDQPEPASAEPEDPQPTPEAAPPPHKRRWWRS